MCTEIAFYDKVDVSNGGPFTDVHLVQVNEADVLRVLMSSLGMCVSKADPAPDAPGDPNGPHGHEPTFMARGARGHWEPGLGPTGQQQQPPWAPGGWPLPQHPQPGMPGPAWMPVAHPDQSWYMAPQPEGARCG